MEKMAELLVVSIDTIRLAYRQLQEEGYLTLSQSTGTVVKVHYSADEIAQNIQTFFAEHKDVILDINRSMPLLFSNIQLAAWKNISLEDLYKIEDNVVKNQIPPQYFVTFYLHKIYGTLNNDLLLRLINKLSIFYMVPFLSFKYCDSYIVNDEIDMITYKIKLCRQKDWAALRANILDELNRHFILIDNFYQAKLIVPDTTKQIKFTWSSYKKASQICYSVGFEILLMIVYGRYPKGSYLPSLKKLAEEKQVSVSTIRNSLALLNDLGIVKTINGVGTQVLSMDQIAENSNLSSPIVQKRLLDCKHSLQIFLLTCHNTAAFTISSLDTGDKAKWIEQLRLYEQLEKLDLVLPFSLKYISEIAPYQTIRVVYSELYKLLFWGVPLRGMMGSQEKINAFYQPYYHVMVDCLERSDAEGFAAKLEEVLYHEIEFVSKQLANLGIQEANL